jgi:glycosyltransferase involved in cell wall biosynthesis
MNIGFFGNTNNYPYALAKGLRASGATVRLVVNRPGLLHRPEGLDVELGAAYPDWIMDASHLSEEDFVAQSPRICDALNFVCSGMDAVVLNDIGPSLFGLLEKPAIALLTGSDLTYLADFASAGMRASVWDPAFRASPGGRLSERRWIEFVTRQREGIRAARAVSFPWPGLVPAGDALLADIGVPAARRMFVYLADTHRISPAPPPANPVLRILNGARLNWVRPMPPGFSEQDAKGTDVLLHGFARFLADGGRAELRLVEKGLHTAETRALVESLGIGHAVVWLPEMDLRSFRAEMAAADVVCDQLSTSFPGMVALDAMALGRPVLANFRPDILGPAYADPWPVCDASDAAGVHRALAGLAGAPAECAALGERARAFAEKWLSPEANARRCLERLAGG